MKLLKGLGVAVSAIAAVLATVPSASAAVQADSTSALQAPAAVNCNWDLGRDTTGVTLRTTKSIRLRYGPAAGCDYIGWTNMPVPTNLWAVCKFRNPDSGNLWYYVDPYDTSWSKGWIYGGNVSVGSGSIPSC